MNTNQRTQLSRFLSRVLRHRPEEIGLELDEGGWVDAELLLERCRARGRNVSRAMLEEVVATSSKARFAFSEDGRRIRASQGHSVDVDLGYAPIQPPERLFHGTGESALKGIRADGLVKMQRHQVHLSPDEETARMVGKRRSRPVILSIRAGEMNRSGFTFYLSDNGVWLTDRVPVEFIDFPSEA